MKKKNPLEFIINGVYLLFVLAFLIIPTRIFPFCQPFTMETVVINPTCVNETVSCSQRDINCVMAADERYSAVTVTSLVVK